MDADPTLRNVNHPEQEVAGPFKDGRLLDGKYEVLSLLGRGGMGAVYRVKHVLLGLELALKTLDIQSVGDAASSRRFQTEAKAAFSLKHPNLVKVHDYGVLEDGQPFLVMDLVAGKTLQTFIKERGQLSLAEIESIFVQLCFGLAHAHQQQVVHRDIKPANIMLADGVPLNVEGSVKVLDFGIAKIVDSDRNTMEALTMTGEVFGSPLYMSPEQCSGGTIDQRSDVYSLGCVLFEALTGTPPLVGSNPLRTMMLHVNDIAPSLKEATLGSQYPEALEHIVAKMLAKSPSDRYRDLGVLAHEICLACSGKKYDPHSGEVEATNELRNREQGRASAYINLSYFQLGCTLVAISIVCIVGTLLISRIDKDQKPNVPKLDAPRQSDRPQARKNGDELNVSVMQGFENSVRPSAAALQHDESEKLAAKQAFDKVARIFATEIIVDKSRMRRINFPTYGCGHFKYKGIDAKGNGSDIKDLAKGTLLVPAEGPLIYCVSSIYDRFAILNPFIFDRFDPNLFTGLSFDGSYNKDFEAPLAGLGIEKDNKMNSEKEIADGAIHLFRAATKWKNLEILTIRKAIISNDLLKIVNEMPYLKRLFLGEDVIDYRFLTKQNFVSKIQEFDILDGEIDELFAGLSNSPHLEQLGLGADCKFKAESLRLLSNCPKLKHITFCGNKFDDATIEAILSLKHLKQFIIVRGVLTEKQKAEILKYCTLATAKVNSNADASDLFFRGEKAYSRF